MLRIAALLAALTLAGCFQSHGIDDGPPIGGRDLGPTARDAGPVVVDPPPSTGGCGDPDGTPEAPECEALCNESCRLFAECGGDFGLCIEGCYAAYACPGETPGHDAAICRGGGPMEGCDSVCAWVPNFGGFARTGPSCPPDTEPDPMVPCSERDYCECTGECEPLVDLTTGCICPCDDPFNCSGVPCDCDCGGARYLGCAPVGSCAETEVSCDLATQRGAIAADGCPDCAPR